MISLRFAVMPVMTLALLEPATVAAQESDRQKDEVLFRCEFESEAWYREWGSRREDEHTQIVSTDPERKFEPFDGKALRIRIDKGRHYGASVLYRFKEQLSAEPEEVYFRYYLRLGDDWDPSGGGKLPGIAGTFGKAGWGGRRVNGHDGWSARGLFDRRRDGTTPTGFYC